MGMSEAEKKKIKEARKKAALKSGKLRDFFMSIGLGGTKQTVTKENE